MILFLYPYVDCIAETGLKQAGNNSFQGNLFAIVILILLVVAIFRISSKSPKQTSFTNLPPYNNTKISDNTGIVVNNSRGVVIKMFPLSTEKKPFLKELNTIILVCGYPQNKIDKNIQRAIVNFELAKKEIAGENYPDIGKIKIWLEEGKLFLENSVLTYHAWECIEHFYTRLPTLLETLSGIG
jgi:hypothetical protein